MVKQKQGSVHAFTLFLLIFALLALTALSFFVSSTAFFVHSVKNQYEQEREALSLLDNIEAELQNMCKEKSHNAFSKTIVHMHEVFANDFFIIEDISSLIHEQFMSDDLVRNDAVASLIASDKQKYTTAYGWISFFYPAPDAVLNTVKKEFKGFAEQDLFPLVNTLSQLNVNYVPEALLATVLKACKIKDADEKAALLAYTAQQEGVDEEHLHDILKVPETHRVFKIVGVQTTFWRIRYKYNTYIVEAVYAGIPDKTKRDNRINEYILVERKIVHD